MNKIFIILVLLASFSTRLAAQTDPTPQTLPYTQTFSTFNGSQTTYPSGMTGWTISGSLGSSFLTAVGSGTEALTPADNASASEFIGDMNGKIGTISTGSNVCGIVLAINATGVTNVQVTFTAATQMQTAGGRINALGLQYRVGTGATTFTNVAGSTYENDALTTNSTAGTTNDLNPSTITVTLPAACNNQAVVELRWTMADISGSGKASFSISNISVQQGSAQTITHYYTKATGNVDNLGTYGTNTNGTGTAPTSFTGGNAVFHIANNNTGTIGANWTVSGAGSRVVIDQNDFIIPSTASLTGPVDVSAGNTLTIQNTTFPTFDSINAASTIIFSSLGTLATIPLPPASGAYGNIIFDNTIVNSTVATDITFAGNFVLQDGASYTDVSGNLFTTGTANQIITGNGGVFSIKNLENNNTGTSPVKSGTLTLAPNTPMTLANSIIMADTGTANQFSDGGNTITVENNITLGGPASGYNLTGTFILSLPSGTANLRADGSSDPVLASFNNITFNTGKASFNGVGDTIYVKGNITVNSTSGKLTTGSNTIALGGNLIYSATTDLFDVAGTGTGTSTIWFNGTSAQTYSSTIAFGNTFYNITISNPAGVTFSNPLISKNALTVFNGSDLSLASGTQFSVAGSISNNGTVNGAGGILMNGSAAQIVSGTGTINNLVLNNTHGATITAGDTLKIAGTFTPTLGTLTTNDALMLLSNASGTARIPAVTGGISGNVIVEQYIPGNRAFRFLGHPFNVAIPLSQLENTIDITGQGGSANGFTNTATNNPSAFSYNPLTGNGSNVDDNTGWIPFENTATLWNSNEGIRVLVRGAKGQGLDGNTYTADPVTISLTGTINTGNVAIPLVAGANSGYNLISNPYPSPVDIGTVITGAANISGAGFYVWNATEGLHGAYDVIPTGAPYYLQANTSFIVNVSGATSLAFAESNKGATGSSLLKTTAGNTVTLHVYDTAYNSWDRTYVSFNDHATDTLDNYDATKLHNADLDFYSLSANNKRLSIDARPFNNGQVIPLGFATDILQAYIIKAEDFNLSIGQQLYLHDKYLGQYQQLNDGSEYRFNITSDPLSQGENRFELTVVNNTTGIANVGTNGTLKMNLVPNPATSQVTVNFTTPQNESTNISVTNIIGQQVFTTSFAGQQNGTVNIPLQNVAQGIYIVILKSGNQTVTQRLVKQ